MNILFSVTYGFFNRLKFGKIIYPKIIFAINTIIFLSVLFAINLLVLSFFLQRQFEIKLDTISRFYFIPILVVNLIYYLKENLYETIVIQYNLKSRRSKLISTILVLIYVLLTVATLLIVVLYL